MARTLLKTIQYATGELGFTQPTVVLSSTDATVTQALALVRAACDELLDEFDWQALIKTHTFATVNGQSQYDLPADYHRMIPATQWNRSTHWEANGNTNSMAWEFLQSSDVSGVVNQRFRIAAGKIEVFPTPTAAETIAFQYITKNYVVDGANSLLKAEFTLDADKTVFHDRLLTNLLKLKLLQVKGFDTRAAVEDFNATLDSAKGNDAPAPVVSLDPQDALWRESPMERPSVVVVS